MARASGWRVLLQLAMADDSPLTSEGGAGMMARLPKEEAAIAAKMYGDVFPKEQAASGWGDGVVEGDDAPMDVALVLPDGETSVALSSLYQKGRPTVLNFGSCS